MNEIKITIDTFVEELNNCVGKEAFDVFKKHIISCSFLLHVKK